MEDGVAFGPDFKTCLNHEALFAHDGCITRLECRPYRTVVAKTCRHRFNGTRLRQQMEYDGGAGAYVIGRAYAAYLLRHYHTPKTPLDDQILNHDDINYRPHKIYQLDPAPATQRMFLEPGSPQFNPESDLQAARHIPDKPAKARGIAAFFRSRAKNARRNLFHVAKVVPFSGAK